MEFIGRRHKCETRQFRDNSRRLFPEFFVSIESGSHSGTAESQFTQAVRCLRNKLPVLSHHFRPAADLLPQSQRRSILQMSPSGLYKISVLFRKSVECLQEPVHRRQKPLVYSGESGDVHSGRKGIV